MRDAPASSSTRTAFDSASPLERRRNHSWAVAAFSGLSSFMPDPVFSMLTHHRRRNIAGRPTMGVTLVETIMVVALLAMATVAGSFMLDGKWHGRRGATDATHLVHGTMSAARNTAIVNQTNVQVRRFTRSGLQWLAVTEEAGPLRDGKKWEMEIGDTATIDGTASEIWFKATGTADRGIEWKIRDGDSSGLVIVTPVDGNITQKLP